ncbi:hypothetical protein T439DRAFT_376028 [Meredithblackwellia eburnea MCA 4105]
MDKKANVIAAYRDLSQSLIKVSAAISDFTNTLATTHDPAQVHALLEGVPFSLPTISAIAGGVVPQLNQSAEDGKKERKAKKIKDPNAPKRPPSAYIEFQNSVRTKFREDAPDLPYQEILRKISAAWATMTDAEKKIWQDVTEEKTAEYEKAKDAYVAEHGEDALMADIAVGPTTPIASTSAAAIGSTNKESKEYTGKKRGRKSNADKLAMASEAIQSKLGRIDDPVQLQQLAQNVLDQETALKKEKKKKEKKAKDEAATVAVAAPAPVASSSKPKTPKKPAAPAPPPPPAAESSEESDSDSDDDSSSEEDSSSDEDDSDDDSSEDEPAPPVSNGKKKAVAVPVSSEKHKSKKSKH